MFGKNKNYPSLTSLNSVKKLLQEVPDVIDEKLKSGWNITIPPAVGAIAGVGAGAAVGHGVLTLGAAAGAKGAVVLTSGLAAAGGIIGGGMLAGLAVVSAPAVVLGVGGYAYASKKQSERLKREEELLLQEALRKHDAILRALEARVWKSEHEREHIIELNGRLRDVIRNLRHDLGEKADRSS